MMMCGIELFRKMIGPVIVRAVGHQRRQLVGFAPGANQMVRRRLAGGIGRVGRIGRRLREHALAAERAEHLVGRDMQKAESRALLGRQPSPIAQRLLQQREGADNVGLDEFAGSVDRAIDMALRRQVHDGVGLVLVEQPAQRRGLADAGLFKCIARIAGRAGERLEVRCIGQLVDIDDARFGVAQEMTHHRRADETRAAGHENRGAPKAHDVGLPPRGCCQKAYQIGCASQVLH